MNLPWTICFIRQADKIYLINRRKPPNMGLWNGVGGRIEPKETPRQCVAREVREETRIRLSTYAFRFAGIVTMEWAGDPVERGMYAFIAQEDYQSCTPSMDETPEGVLAWHSIDWICSPDNEGVVSNLPHFLPPMLNKEPPCDYHCIYDGLRLVSFEQRPIPAEYAGV